mgnify:CR=1 FL=1
MNLNLSEKLKTGLTPQEKIDCYEYCLNTIDKFEFICIGIIEYFGGDHLKNHEPIFNTLFPELIKLKPSKVDFGKGWFNSTEERIQVLNKLIEEQKKLL